MQTPLQAINDSNNKILVGKPKEYPLSAAQQSLWYLHEQSTIGTAYHTAFVASIHSKVDVTSLQQASQALFERHNSLRSTITCVGDKPCQVVHDDRSIDFAHVLCPPAEGETAWRQRVQCAYAHPFDLEQGPLFRVHLFTRTDTEHVLLISAHHLIMDGLSMRVLLEELALLYGGLLRSMPPQLPALRASYQDFVTWEKETLHQQEEALWQYWREQLSDVEPLQLPLDRPRPAVQSYRGASFYFQVPTELLQKLEVLNGVATATLHSKLLTAFQILLYRYSGQSCFTVGIPGANRLQPEFQRLVGYLTNLLPIRTEIAAGASFYQMLQEATRRTFAATMRQTLPFSHIVARLNPTRDLSYAPITQVTFGFLPSPKGLSGYYVTPPDPVDQHLTAWSEFHLSPFALPQQEGQFDLTLEMEEDAGRLLGRFKYNTDLFDEATIARIAGHFEVLLNGIAAHPEQPVLHLPMLTAAEYQQIVHEWNDTAVDFGPPQTIHALFEQQVARTPDAVAVVMADNPSYEIPNTKYELSSQDEGSHNPQSKACTECNERIQNCLTYAQLNERANQLAHHLIELGVKADTLVAVAMERSIEMVVSLLAVLKAGGAYVPIDPTYPQERIAYMLADSAAPILLTQSYLPLAQEAAHCATHLIAVDTISDQLAGLPTDNPQTTTTPADLAYVIYTSGSTGQPKGTMIPHTNVWRLLAATEAWYAFNADDVWSFFHSFAFDFSVWEVWGALCYGGRLVVVPYLVSRDPQHFYQLLCEQGITVLNQTPSAFRQLIPVATQSLSPHALRYVIFGGEALEFESLRPWFAHFGDAKPQLVNMYGITETTVHVTYQPIQAADLEVRRGSSRIGRAIPDLKLYILDDYATLVPIGIAGELFVGGAGLARGYLNRPDLTAERFIEHPEFGRLYKTGDLCRWLPDGNIEYLGRTDFQVKIRGFRIELGEIENALLAQAGVREAVVVVREEIAGDKRLVAYLVASDKEPGASDEMQSFIPFRTSSETLRQALLQRLPDYMIPSAFVTMEALPLTPNGKLDRKALPAPDYTEAQTAFVAPRTALEAQVATIWSDVLGLKQTRPEQNRGIGIDDNFFALGGHSLLATQVISRVRRQCHCEVPLKALFEAPQLADFAQRILQQQRALERQSRPPIQAVGRDGPLPLSYAQQRLWFLDQLEANSAFYNIPLTLRLAGDLNVAALTQSLSDLIRRHESLRTTFEMVGGEPRQVIHPPAPLPLRVTTVESEAAAQALADQAAATPFNLREGPLLRVQLLRVSEAVHWLLLTMHHIISDGWSLNVLVKEVSQAYHAYSQGGNPSFPALALDYADFAHWQRAYLSGERVERQLAFWREQLKDAPALLELPTDHPRPAVQSHRGACLSFQLESELTTQLKQLAQQHDATLFMLLLAAFNILLARYSRQNDIVVGTPIANRNHAEIEGLIGFFVNTLALRTRLDDNPSFTQLLARVRQTTLAAYEQQDLPFEQLVDALQPERTLRYSPLFQIMLVLQNAFDDAFALPHLTLPHLTVTQQPTSFAFAKFDLTLFLSETNDGLAGSLEYNTDLFDPSTIVRLVGHFETLLKGMIAHPEQPVLQLPLLTTTEYQQIVHEWNDTAVDFGPPQTIHALFEQQVARTPDAIAVVLPKHAEIAQLGDFVAGTQSNDWEIRQGDTRSRNRSTEHSRRSLAISHSLTYSELNERANQLAHYLIALGVQPDTLVAVAMERSIEMVVALLAVLKAGGAYVPIDPAYPPERIHYMLTDSAAPILLTQSHLTLAQAAAQYGTHVIAVDRMSGQLAGQATTNPQTQTTPNHLAYVIYTSGSTGRPKGAANQHAGVFNRLCWTQHQFHLTPADRVLQKTPFSFDVSVWEFFWTLMSGACLVVAQPEGHKDPAYLHEVIQQHGITLLHFVPSMLRQFIMTANGQHLTTLRMILTSGEALPLDLAQLTQRRLPTTALHNLYGPTEAAVDVSHWAYQNDSLTIPIGKPIANTTLYVLDRAGCPLPIGVSGELYIGGVQLARGYLNRPDLTAERFIEHPELGRLYKTGDLCRWLPDGNIEYIGRTDFQVKIRGFRIELGEIESALLAQEGVREAVVVVREEIAGDKRLVAYLVGEAEGGTLRQTLAHRLPDYMLPAAFVRLEAFPLTPNGKLDRRALPAPDYSDAQAFFVAPRNKQEAQLAAIWGDVLKLERVGVHDNFFALGGDSILSIQIIAKAQQAGLQLSLQQLFQHQTIAALSHQVTPAQEVLLPSTAFALLKEADRQQIPADIEDAYPLAALQAGMVFHSELNPESAVYHDIFSYQLQAPFAEEALRQALQALAARHPILRTRFALADYSEPLQLVQRSVIVPLEVVDLRHVTAPEQEERLQAWIAAEKQRPFLWKQAPLLRLQIHRRSDEQFNLTLSFHHAILDGWSVASLMTELLQCYFAYLGYAFTQPTPPAASYHQFVVLERAILADTTGHHYWRTALQDGAVSKLPRWPQTPPRPINAGIGRLSWSLPPELSNGLHQLAQQAGVPIKSVLLAAHLNALRVLSNQTDMMTGLVYNGRPESADGERVLGLFLNTLPFRLALNGGSWLELVQQVFAQECKLLPFRRYPLAAIQQIQGGTPLFETAFNFISFHVYERLADIAGLVMMGGTFFEQNNFALTANFHLDSRSGQLQLDLSYDPQQFCVEQIETILSYYETSLIAMHRDPTANYRTISLLSASEYQQIVHEWNDTAVDFGPPQTIHALFEQQVQRTPDAPAVVLDEEQLTYAELNRRANQLAHYLRQTGIGVPAGCEKMIGVCMERSAETVISLLAIFKAGGVYVPLDPALPPDRLSYMLTHAATQVVLTKCQYVHILAPLAAIHPMEIIALDNDETLIAQQPTDTLPNHTTPQSLAYVIYTSGSTGLPKGAMVEQQGMVNHLYAKVLDLKLTSNDRIAQTAPQSFDISIWQFLAGLLVGGTVHIFDDESVREPARLLAKTEAEQITVLEVVPSLFRFMLDELTILQSRTAQQRPRFAELRWLLLTGEALPQRLCNEWFAYYPTIPLMNAYGPTECSDDVTHYVIHRPLPSDVATVPIGRPLANMHLYILDAYRLPTPVGVAGELYVGGICVGRGYLNDPERTAKAFLDDPFVQGKEGQGRFYRTGDLARYQPDGTIEFLGRTDFQVKIRGFRIELGEIESALLAQEGVRNAVVLARQDDLLSTGETRLVAYLVGDVESEVLRHRLSLLLPDYMLPAAFVFLDTLPLTPSGKLDRQALPKPTYSTSTQSHLPASTFEEARLMMVWQEVLGVQAIGVEDSFFELGGHSLLATQLIHRIRQALGRTVSLRQIFATPTIRRLLQSINHDQNTTTSFVPLRMGNEAHTPLFLIHAISGVVFPFVTLLPYLPTTQPVYALQARGIYDDLLPFDSLEALATATIQEMKSIQPTGPYALGGWSFGGMVAFEIAQQLTQQGEAVSFLGVMDSYPSLSAQTIPHETLTPQAELQAILYLLGGVIGNDYRKVEETILVKALESAQPIEWLLTYISQQGNQLLLDAAILQRIWQTIQHNRQLIQAYQPQPYTGNITLFCAEQSAPIDGIQRWQALTSHPVDAVWVSGEHNTMLQASQVETLGCTLEKRLKEVNGRF